MDEGSVIDASRQCERRAVKLKYCA